MTEDEWVESGYLAFERTYFSDLVLRTPWQAFVAWLLASP